MSLDEKIVELRKCLTANHTDTCPLCGQHISEIHLDKEFKGMLSPLEEMQKNTSAALLTAEDKRNEVMITRLRTNRSTNSTLLKSGL